MINLLLDTSSSFTLIALFQNGGLLDQMIYPHQNKLSSLLTVSIQNFLKKHDLSPNDLGFISVGIGPGSYTGTRVGVAVAKSLSLGLEIPLVSFNSLLAFIPEQISGPFALFMETKQGSPFFLEAIAKEDGFVSESSGKIEIRDIPSFAQNKLCFAIDPDLFLKTHPEASSLKIQKGIPSLQRLGMHLQRLFKEGKRLSHFELDKLELIYLHSLNLTPIPTESLTLPTPSE